MGDNIGWLMLSGGVPLIAVISFWLKLGDRISKAEESGKAAMAKAQAAEMTALTVQLKTDSIAQNMHRIEVDAASKIAALNAVSDATAKSLMHAETRLAKSVEDIAASMDHLSETIIKTLGELAGKSFSK